MRSYSSWPRALNELSEIEGSTEERREPTSLSLRRCLSLSPIGLWPKPQFEESLPLYKELNRDKKEIRLLVVEPGFEWEPVRATFKQAFLTDSPKPKYETISYAWGDATQRSTIYLHGKSLNVPASSEAALRRRRYDHKACVLWIDAICINQDDDSERGHQVGMMADIYGSTWRNLVWLGEDDRYTEAALDSIEELNEEFRRETDDLSNSYDTLYTSKGQYNYSSKQLKAKIDPEALMHFYRRSWFSRLWVVQEAALACQSDCFCGRHAIALERVLRAARWLLYKFDSGHGVSPKSIDGCALMFDYADHEHGLYAGKSALKLRMIDLLTDLQDFSATEPRDHIFALLGLWQKHHPNERLPASVEPDYMSPLSDVLRRASQLAIQDEGSIYVLRSVHHRIDEPEIPGLPTWVPRWHEAFDLNILAFPIATYTEWPRSSDILMDFEETGLLSVKGFVLDDVQQAPLPVTRWQYIEGTLRHWREIEWILSHHLLINLASHCEILSEFARIGAPELRDQKKNLYHELMSSLSKEGDGCEPGKNCPGTEEFQNLRLFQSGLFNLTNNRKFFITSSKYFGFGPQTMRKGDVLALLYGLGVPAILRPSSSYPGDYEFVGIAGVYGIMKGEAVYKMWDEGKDYYRIRLR